MRALLLLAVSLPLWAQGENALACVKTGPESLEYSAMARVTWTQGAVIANFMVTSEGKAQDLKTSGTGPRLLHLTVEQFLTKWTFSPDCKGPLQLRFEYTLRGKVSTPRSPQTILVPPNTYWILDNPMTIPTEVSSLTQPVK